MCIKTVRFHILALDVLSRNFYKTFSIKRLNVLIRSLEHLIIVRILECSNLLIAVKYLKVFVLTALKETNAIKINVN